MDEKQLQRGNALADQIKKTAEWIRYWKAARSISSSGIQTEVELLIEPDNREPYISNQTAWLAHSPETFTIVKALNIQHFTDKLAALQKEYDAL